MNNYLQKKCPTINSKETGQNIKRIMKARGFNVKDVQEYLKLACPQSIYHWFEGKSVPNIVSFLMFQWIQLFVAIGSTRMIRFLI